jgi:hypothetical protein
MNKPSKHFVIQELVPPVIFGRFGQRSWWFIQPNIVAVLDQLRDDLGRAVVVNNWHRRGHFSMSGYRTPETKVGAAYSMHRMGLAADVKVAGVTPAEVLAVIQADLPKYLSLGLTTVENLDATPTWLHLDCRRWMGREPQTELVFVNP